MAERKQPRQSYEARDFPGLATAADATDLPPGTAVKQVNVVSSGPGELSTRQGCKPLTFEEE